jgi:hypothetical protein
MFMELIYRFFATFILKYNMVSCYFIIYHSNSFLFHDTLQPSCCCYLRNKKSLLIYSIDPQKVDKKTNDIGILFREKWQAIACYPEKN